MIGVRGVRQARRGVNPVRRQRSAPRKQGGVGRVLRDLFLEPSESPLSAFSIKRGHIHIENAH